MTKEYKPYFIEDIKEEEMIFEEIPWINAPQLNQNISIET